MSRRNLLTLSLAVLALALPITVSQLQKRQQFNPPTSAADTTYVCPYYYNTQPGQGYIFNSPNPNQNVASLSIKAHDHNADQFIYLRYHLKGQPADQWYSIASIDPNYSYNINTYANNPGICGKDSPSAIGHPHVYNVDNPYNSDAICYQPHQFNLNCLPIDKIQMYFTGKYGESKDHAHVCQPTWNFCSTPQPTNTPQPTIPQPTNTPQPTIPQPTSTPYPSQPPYSTTTPYPTQTPYPTNTPYPFFTPYPTNTPYPYTSPTSPSNTLPTNTPRPTVGQNNQLPTQSTKQPLVIRKAQPSLPPPPHPAEDNLIFWFTQVINHFSLQIKKFFDIEN